MDERIFTRAKEKVLFSPSSPVLAPESMVAYERAKVELNALLELKHRPYTKQEYLGLVAAARKKVEDERIAYNLICAQNEEARKANRATNIANHTAAIMTFDNLLKGVREVRSQLLADCDYIDLPNTPDPKGKKSKWLEYRQQLRDITNNLNTVADIESLVFPSSPQ